MNTCPNCGKIAGLHSSILQGCMCQYSMQAPPKKEWIGLTYEEQEKLIELSHSIRDAINRTDWKLREKNAND